LGGFKGFGNPKAPGILGGLEPGSRANPYKQVWRGMAHPDGQDGGMAILDGVWRHPAILAHRQAWDRLISTTIRQRFLIHKMENEIADTGAKRRLYGEDRNRYVRETETMKL